MRSPSTVGLLVVPQIHFGCTPIRCWHCFRQAARDVCRNYKSWQQEVRAPVVTGPLAIIALDLLVEGEALPCSLERVTCWFGLLCRLVLPFPSGEPRCTEQSVPGIWIGYGVKGWLLLVHYHQGPCTMIEDPDLLSSNLVWQQVLLWLLFRLRPPTCLERPLRAWLEFGLLLELLLRRNGVPWVGVGPALATPKHPESPAAHGTQQQ
mmetsp:Transcript_129131/g.334818  ORF Transcript_129131/g.334818 Transcript_129131/m.334818 type:complete len:207 (+) Transcript_129131:1069-1689(+)